MRVIVSFVLAPALVIILTAPAFALSVDDQQWIPEMYKCGNNVYQFICTVSDTVNSISTCRPTKAAAAENAWTRFNDDFGIEEKMTLTCKKLW